MTLAWTVKRLLFMRGSHRRQIKFILVKTGLSITPDESPSDPGLDAALRKYGNSFHQHSSVPRPGGSDIGSVSAARSARSSTYPSVNFHTLPGFHVYPMCKATRSSTQGPTHGGDSTNTPACITSSPASQCLE